MLNALIHRFPRTCYITTVAGMYVQLVAICTVVIASGVVIFNGALHAVGRCACVPGPLQIGFAGGMAFVGITFTLPATLICFRWLLRVRVPEGTFPLFSVEAVVWATYNLYIVIFRFTLMNFIRGTPLHPLFYRLMGGKFGKQVFINTLLVADCTLLTVGDHAVLGGDCTVICHSYERGKLVTRPVRIGNNVDIGINAIILPGVTIGDRAVVAAGAVVPKNTVIPPDTMWAGVPARQVRELGVS